ncbi:MAG TPA: thioredoxin domain-containing protein [Pyrinomonadaceae bacterium]|nr:thioredoxin domain-containing protein [Pyrinomonadaceae bacterium]
MKRKLPVIIIVAVLLAALGGGALLMRSSESSPSSTSTTNTSQPKPDPKSNRATSAPTSAPNVSPAAHSRGAANAPLLLEEFGDFQCPPCGSLHPILKRVEQDYASRVRVVFHNYPIRSRHKHAAEAARAAEAAGLQGKFWEMHDLLFEKQKEWEEAESVRPIFLNYARTLGLDAARFAQDIDGTLVSNRVLNDEAEAQSRGVTGTPTVFINGREVPFEETTTYEKLAAVINRELAAANK